jgi:hypothetical protein
MFHQYVQLPRPIIAILRERYQTDNCSVFVRLARVMFARNLKWRAAEYMYVLRYNIVKARIESDEKGFGGSVGGASTCVWIGVVRYKAL